MTRVCLVGADDATLPEDLLSYPTARDALDPYDLETPFVNAVAVETISIGAAVSLLNDLDWYLVRLADDALVLEPSVSGEEWLSRDLATAIRNETVEPGETGTFLKIYGVVHDGDGDEIGGDGDLDGDGETGVHEAGADDRADGHAGDDDLAEDDAGDDNAGEGEVVDGSAGAGSGPPRLTEPLFAQRVDGEVPTYDLRAVEGTLVVRVTPEEFGGG